MTILQLLRKTREHFAKYDFMALDCPHLERLMEKQGLTQDDNPADILDALDAEIEALEAAATEGGDDGVLE